LALEFLQQKKPGQKAGLQRWNRIGDAGSDGPQKGESGPTPGYSVFTKKALQIIN